MNRLVAMAFAIVLGAGAAHAADYPRVDPGLLPEGVPVLMWEGAYFGANVGWGTGDFEAEAGGLRGSLDADGAFGGVHIGYNKASGASVYGLEADIQLSNISGGWEVAPVAGVSGKLTWFSTLRGRVGLASGNFLLYGTGGLAVGGGKADAYVGAVSASESNIHIGWTLGVGAEMALNHELSARLEYLYVDFGKERYGDANVGLKAHLFRIGATAHF